MRRTNSVKVFDHQKKESINRLLKSFGLRVSGGCIETQPDNTKTVHVGFANAGTTINEEKISDTLKEILKVDHVVLDGRLVA